MGNTKQQKQWFLAMLFSVLHMYSFAQINIPNTTPVTQNFDGMNAGTALPANWKMSPMLTAAPTWAAGGNFTAVSVVSNAGSPVGGGRYNWGTTPGTDRAIGFMTSGSYDSPNSIMAHYSNTNASDITQLDVSFNIERYRINTATCEVRFFYSLNGTAWTAVAAGDVAIGVFATGANSYTFGAPQSVNRTASITGLTVPTGSSIYLRWHFVNTGSSNSQGLGLDDVSVTAAFGVCVTASEPTTQAASMVFSSVNCTSMTVSWTGGNGSNNLVVVSSSPISALPTDNANYNANTAFGMGGTIASGVYTVYNGTGSSVTVTNLTQSVIYYFKVFEFNGAGCPASGQNYLTTGTLLSSSQVSATCASGCPEVMGVLVDACGPNEGLDELMTFTNGSSPLSMSDLSVTFPNGGTFCNSGCGALTWVTDPAYVANLNTIAGCTLFYEANPIPANVQVMVFTSNIQTFNFDFTGACASAPIYAVFANNSTTTGRFANYDAVCATGARTLTASFGGSCADTVTYVRCNLSNTDGDFVQFSTNGTPTYMNDGTCTPTTILLPVSYTSVSVKSTDDGNLISWQTSQEKNNDYFTVLKSFDAKKYYEIYRVKGQGNTDLAMNYEFLDATEKNKSAYYKIQQTDFDGRMSFSNVVFAPSNNLENFFGFITSPRQYENNVIADVNIIEESSCQLELVSSLGIVIHSERLSTEVGTNKISIPAQDLPNGIYFLKVQSNEKTIVSKFMILN